MKEFIGKVLMATPICLCLYVALKENGVGDSRLFLVTTALCVVFLVGFDLARK